ncbi:MAG: LytR/AlgR family response regulator transcription factor [Lachnospiraceae bacterium]
MLQIAICDEDGEFLDSFQSEIKKQFIKRNMLCGITTYMNPRKFVREYEEERQDVVFLAAKMKYMDGFEVAQKIREINENVYIVFVSTQESLVYDSFEFSPFGFLHKTEEGVMNMRLEQVVRRLIDTIMKYEKVTFMLAFGERISLEVNRILYMQSHSNYVVIYVDGMEELRVRSKISEMMEKLSRYPFLRIHQRVIVNMYHIEQLDMVEGKVQLDSGVELNISRSYRSNVEEKYPVFRRNVNR